MSGGNSQLTWDFQDSIALMQLDWLKKEKSLEEVLAYADQQREFSSYFSE